MREPQPVVYVVAWAVLVGTLFFGARGVDGVDHAHTTAELICMRAQLSGFDQRLQGARFGDDDADEELPLEFAKLEMEAASLPSRVEFGRHGEAAAALVSYMDALRSVRANVGRASALAALFRQEAQSPDAHELGVVSSSLDEELAAIAAHDLFGACESVLMNYERAFGEELDEAEIYRIGLYLLTAILLVRLMQSMRESQARTAELRTANRTLEDRVDERTHTLSSTNRALESAIAEARRAELDARSAREAAETANRTKSSFLANMSHEIRTPMTSILGFSERLLDGEISNADRADAIATIRRNGEHLTQLVSDILDLSKIEAGRLSLELVSTPLLKIVTDLRDAMAPRAQERDLEFVIEWRGAVPEMVLTDPLRLEQVLFNLVGNAIKFTDCGRIVARIGYEPPRDSSGVGRLQFEIEDSGIGMDEETISRLFRPFVQGDSSTTRRFGGTGLGLSICSHLVGRLGGSFHVTSEVGRGSVFAFDVEAGPLEGALLDAEVIASAPPASVRAAPPRLSGMRVLLAEDGEDNQRLLRYLLASAGASVSLAVDGEDAVHLALAASAHDRAFDVVLMDMQMPRLDGYEATRRLRKAGYEQPIVALTANAMAPDRERCLSAGCDDYCAKPVRRADLLETVFRWRKAGSEEEPDMALQSNRRIETDQDEGLMELVRSFVDDLAQDMSSMRAALAAQDIERLSMLAHRLKGAAGSYGFPEITRQAAQLEGALGSGIGSTSVACELASLEAICAAARGSSES